MAHLGCSCVKQVISNGKGGKAKVKALMTMAASARAVLSTTSDISEHVSKDHSASARTKGYSAIRSLVNSALNVRHNTQGVGYINSLMSFEGMALRGRTGGVGEIDTGFVDKFNNKPEEEFNAVQRLYPIADVFQELDGKHVVNESLESINLYDSINEGVYTGNYTQPSGNSILVSDEDTYIQPSSIDTNGAFRYSCQMTSPVITPLDSLLVIRASAPTSNFYSLGPPKYKLHDITLSDPYGNVIIEYEDVSVIGDDLFATYFSQPITNNTTNFRNDPYPVLGEPYDYVLNINIDASCYIDDPFSPEYNEGYQDSCIRNPMFDASPVPTPSLKISAIEINNSGSMIGLLGREMLPFSIKIDEYGDNISRRILPATILDSNYVSTVWPTTPSVWESSETLMENLVGRNTNPSGISVINGLMSGRVGSITLVDTGDIPDSGKLNMMFSHTLPKSVTGLTGGPFSFGKPALGWDSASVGEVPGVDDWFTVRNVKLLLKARKAPGTRDYVIDVVGYSDDKILNVTPKRGGFLQNPEGLGDVPLASGFQEVDDLAISSETISDKSEYFERTFGNQGGDHYRLTTSPVVNSVDWADYEIPLAIYEDDVQIGKSPNYTMASYFEKLYLDIYPLPLGAELADIRLEIDYGPSNALMMHSLGHEAKFMSDGNVVIFPSSMKSVDDYLNSNIDQNPLSLVSDIPHGFASPDTIKTNYSRRWRGTNSDIKTGPFDPLAYDASFENQESSHAFNKFYIDFDNIDGNFAISKSMGAIDLQTSGTIVGDTFANRLIKNVGQRFNSTKKYPASPRTYNSIDYAGAGHVLEGRITDAYKNAVILGNGATLNYSSHGDVATGVALFARCTPNSDIDITSGVHTILSNFSGQAGIGLSIANGFFRATMYDDAAGVAVALDTHPASEYTFPVSILATYSEKSDGVLRLYVDNEIAASGWSLLRAETPAFTAASTSQDISTQDSFIMSEVGISVPCNIVSNDANARDRETTVDALFDSMRVKFWENGQDYTDDRYKLWDYVNDDITGWTIGAFNYEQFDRAYDQYTVRGSDDLLIHEFVTDGSPYSDITDMSLPSSVNTSGISYHSQLENDMLRFHIADITNLDEGERLWSTRPRISKSIPRDYKFEERAFVVESVVEHESDVQIPWPWDGYVGSQNFGPKIIVSLYSRTKEPNTFNAQNWGLISRKSHYIHPVHDSLIRLSTTFNYDDLTDVESEPWAAFDQSKNTSELASKYFTSDINEMIVQYDIVYPSDTAFTSTFKLHTTHIGLENALLESRTLDNSVNLSTSGNLSAANVLDFSIDGHIESSGIVNLMTDGTPMLYASGDMPLYTPSAYFGDQQLPMYVHTVGTIGFGGGFGSLFGVSAPPVMNMSIVGGNQAAYDSIPLTLAVSDINDSPQDTLGMFVQQDLLWKPSDIAPMILATRGGNVSDTILRELMPLSVAGSTDIIPSGSMNLTIDATPPPSNTVGSVGLFSVTNLAFDPSSDYQISIDWNGDNPGTGITFADQDAGVAFLDLLDEIRGVQTICWGTCSSAGTCIQLPIITHGIQWYDGACIEGGVLRVIRTYTNPEASGFMTPTPYDNNFYGIRKYTGLQPYSLYDIIITGRTASNKIIDVPSLVEEWEYGKNEEVAYSGVKITEEAERHLNDHYGKAVEVTDELMFIGSPNYTLLDSEDYELENAGAVFIYRRQPEPSGADWSEQYHKAGWDFEDKLELPMGFRRDAYVDVPKEFDQTSLVGTERVWSVGQEGRQLGRDISAAITDREIVAVSAPSSMFSRRFPALETEPVNIALFVLTNEFIPEIQLRVGKRYIKLTAQTIKAAMEGKDVEFTYFAEPSTRFNIQMVVVEPILGVEESSPPFPEPAPAFVTKRQIDRHLTYDRLTTHFQDVDDKIYQQLIDIYHERFPLRADQANSGIPPILGIYVDDSASLRERAIQPATDRFAAYWQNYTFDNGLRDYDGVNASGHVSYVAAKKENWIYQSIDLLNDVLSTGNMIENDYYKLFANGVGPAFYQSQVTEANTPPASGGAAFIFEKFDNGWAPIQRIDSPTESNIIYPDNFAHSLELSKDGSSLIIGSPYIDEAVKFYERNDYFLESVHSNIGQWLEGAKVNNAYLAVLYSQYEDMVAVSGLYSAGEHIYNTITPSGRYQYINDKGYKQYEETFTYSHSDAYPVGQWGFMADLFMPSPRMGYSVAVNEDGTSIAAGSPTDSINIQNNIPLWYRPGAPSEYDGWQSSVNAGSVSVWNTRDYYPHNKAVQYGRFGNLHEILNKDNDPSGTYDHMNDIYNNIGVEFDKMPFSVVDIPEDAGLMYLITPASGALSEEILDNIEDWLALGDRHLVLVGNDPMYEANGAYLNSNNIINEILRKVDSRMVIQPARNSYEACISGVPYELNAIESTKVQNSISTVGYGSKLVGSGYGDIKLYDPEFYVNDWVCFEAGSENGESPLPYYWEMNRKCEMPQMHLGDLRAQWNDVCYDPAANALLFVNNIAYGYGTYRAGCDSEKRSVPYKPNWEPKALMAAAESPAPYTIMTGGVPERTVVRYDLVGYKVVEDAWGFAEIADSGLAFLWTDSQESGVDVNVNQGLTTSPSRFQDPDYYDGRDGIIQARATTNIVEEERVYTYQDPWAQIVEEKYGRNGSSVMLVASVTTENKGILDSNDGDINQNMYANMVGKNSNGESRIAQLGGWTDRTGFKDGYSFSVLYDVFRRNGNYVDQNVSMSDLTLAQNGYNVAWIANSSGTMSNSDIQQMKSWLDTGDKKLIITFGEDESDLSIFSSDIAQAVTRMCDDLGIKSRPLFLPGLNRFADARKDATSGNTAFARNQAVRSFKMEPTYMRNGFTGFDSSIENFTSPGTYSPFGVEIGEDATLHARLVGSDGELVVRDNNFVNVGLPEMFSGTTRISATGLLPGSGYRIFFSTVAESPAEKEKLEFYVANGFGLANRDYLTQPAPSLSEEGFNQGFDIVDVDYETRKEVIVDTVDFISGPSVNTERDDIQGIIKTRKLDVLVPSDASGVMIYVQTEPVVGTVPVSPSPRTPRVVAVSGALVPMEIVTKNEPVFEKVEIVYPEIPDQPVVVYDDVRQISTGSTKYCPYDPDMVDDYDGIACSGYFYDGFGGDPLIADGPVIVAQEIYYNRPFDAGENRSRITVISDASLIEGASILTEAGGISDNLRYFLHGLYPESPTVERGGKHFIEYEKIVSQERASPHQLYANTGNSGLMTRFQGTSDGILDSGTSLDLFSDKESSIAGRNELNILAYSAGKPSRFVKPYDGPPRPPEVIEQIKLNAIAEFDSRQYEMGGTARFSGIYEGVMYTDAGPRGGTPQIMEATGYDYLDFNKFPSGYPGDLFGYSISLFGDKLLIGSPFVAWNSEQITDWDTVKSQTEPLSGSLSGAIIGHNGGAGAAYLYERKANDIDTFNPVGEKQRWSMTRKFRPSGINTGQDLDDTTASQAYKYLGLNSYTEEELKQLSTTSDMFGHDVDMEYDMLVISAPGHDFGNKFAETPAAYQRKSFNREFNIQEVIYTDLGPSGVRDAESEGTAVLNNGAVFSYQNNITDWGSKTQEWEYLQKIVPQGYNSNVAGLSDNDMFGTSVSLNRSLRVDGDYILVAGAPHQNYGTSGTAPVLEKAGAAYTFEAMLRTQPPAFAESGSWINASVYGDKPLNPDASMQIGFNNGLVPNQIKSWKGRVLSDSQGQIFLEASGQDMAPRGYVEHRPYIEAVQGFLTQGEEEVGLFRLSTFGSGPVSSGAMPLYVGSEGGIVYNDIGMYTGGILGYGSGTMNLAIQNQSGILNTSTVNMVASGVGFNIDTLDLRTRGK